MTKKEEFYRWWATLTNEQRTDCWYDLDAMAHGEVVANLRTELSIEAAEKAVIRSQLTDALARAEEAERENAAWRALAEHAALHGESAYMFGHYRGACRMAPQSSVRFDPQGIGPDFGAAAIDLATKLRLLKDPTHGG